MIGIVSSCLGKIMDNVILRGSQTPILMNMMLIHQKLNFTSLKPNFGILDSYFIVLEWSLFKMKNDSYILYYAKFF